MTYVPKKSCKNVYMPQITSAELAEIRKIATQMLDLADRIDGNPVVVAAEVQSAVAYKLENRICLACDSKIPEGIKVKRGQEESCYNTTRNRIRRGDVRERDLIMQGKLTSENASPGRPAKQDRTDEEKARMVAEDLAAYNAKKAKRKADGDE